MSDEIDVRALRERLGWTQSQMAEHLGLDRSSVSRLETGQHPKGPTEKLLRALAMSPAPALETGSNSGAKAAEGEAEK